MDQWNERILERGKCDSKCNETKNCNGDYQPVSVESGCAYEQQNLGFVSNSQDRGLS